MNGKRAGESPDIAGLHRLDEPRLGEPGCPPPLVVEARIAGDQDGAARAQNAQGRWVPFDV